MLIQPTSFGGFFCCMGEYIPFAYFKSGTGSIQFIYSFAPARKRIWSSTSEKRMASSGLISAKILS